MTYPPRGHGELSFYLALKDSLVSLAAASVAHSSLATRNHAK